MTVVQYLMGMVIPAPRCRYHRCRQRRKWFPPARYLERPGRREGCDGRRGDVLVVCGRRKRVLASHQPTRPIPTLLACRNREEIGNQICEELPRAGEGVKIGVQAAPNIQAHVQMARSWRRLKVFRQLSTVVNYYHPVVN